MKKSIIIGLIALAFVSCSENKESENITEGNRLQGTSGYTIDCDFGGVDISKAYLSQYVKGNWEHKDSAAIIEGKFSFSGELEIPELWYIKFDDKKEYVSVFIENSNISISGSTLDRDSVTILGSSIHDALTKFNEGQEGFYTEIDKMEVEYMAAS
jgi:hypothetical protein